MKAIDTEYTLLIIAFILGALIFLRKRGLHYYKIKKSKRILAKLKDFEFDGARINYLKKIDPFVFEELILTAFENKGFTVRRNKRYTGDGGVDGVIFDSGNRKFLIQCKRYKSYVNRSDIFHFQELVSVTNSHGGFFCHTGKTGKNTYRIFADSNIKILSGSSLLKLIG